MSPSGQTEAGTGAAPGERLRLARETLKLSQQDVAERIRISVDKVAALENDEIAKVGAPVFAVGYIRAYARIVSLPADELIPEFTGLAPLGTRSTMQLCTADDGDLTRPRSRRPVAFSRGNGRRRGRLLRTTGLVSLVLASVAAGLWMIKSGNLPLMEAPREGMTSKPLPQQPRSEPLVPEGSMPGGAVPEPSAAAPEEKGVAAGGLVLAIPDRDMPASTPAPVVIDEGFSVGLDIQPVPSADEQAAAEDTVVADSENELRLYFLADSWVEIRDARGERLIHQLARAGQTHVLHGMAPFAVVLGYVPGVSLLLDGEAVDLGKYQGRRLARFAVGGTAVDEN